MVAEFPPHFLTGEAAVVGYGVKHLVVPGADLSKQLLPIGAQFGGALVYAPVLADNHIEEFHCFIF
jgi:hypothetical protein